MRILALGPKGLVRPHIHSSMVRAFNSLGAEVLEFGVPSNPDLLRTLIESVRGLKLDVVFTLDLGAEDYFIAHLLDVQRLLGIPFVVWFVDDPEGYGYPTVCDHNRTIAFCWDQGIVDRWSSNGECLILHLPLAADPALFYPERVREPHRGSVGVFVGSTTHRNDFFEEAMKGVTSLHNDAESIWRVYRRDFRQSLQSLTWRFASRKTGIPVDSIKKDAMWKLWAHSCLYAIGIKKRVNVVFRILGRKGRVFGDEAWRHWLPERKYNGRVRYGKALRKVYNDSAFVLETRQSQAQTGPTQRLFDAAACAIPVVAEWSPEICAYFEPQEECLCFHTLDEGEEIERFLTADREEAKRIGTRALRRVQAHHRYLDRAAHIMESLNRHF